MKITFFSVMENVVLNKPSFQMSLFSNSGVSEHMNDGNTDGHFGVLSCMETNDGTNPWWSVDMEVEQLILRVKVFNRDDCCSEYNMQMK